MPNLNPNHDLGVRLRKLEEAVHRLSTRDVLQNASIGAGGLTVMDDGNITVQGGGSVTVEGGGSMQVNDGGSIAVGNGGEVTVAGLVLSSVVFGSINNAKAIGFAVPNNPGATTPLVTSSIPVPAGYTTAVIFAFMTMYASNTSGVTDQLWGSVSINGQSGGTAANTTVSGQANGVTAQHSVSLTGVSGRISVVGNAGTQNGTWPASSGNAMSVNAIAIFTE